MNCPNCKKEVGQIFTNHNSGYPLDNDKSKVCEFCTTDKEANNSKSLKELNEERKK